MNAERRLRWRSVLRLTGRDPQWLGYWLRRHRRTEGLTPGRLAARLGLSMEGLMLLSLCRSPRDHYFQEDLAVVCARTGADAAALAQVLRQEQGLARWAGQSPPAQGWLMAASDKPVPPPPSQPPEETPPPPDQEGPHEHEDCR
jgi:hypothetical protein